MTAPSRRERILGAILGVLVGDALGVPVEFMSRKAIAKNPVRDMRGYGTHNQPPGTWSDDGSMMLCTLASLSERGYDPPDMMKRFAAWCNEAYMTPHGEVFDIGGATSMAIRTYGTGARQSEWGCTGERSNGNGSLMRIMPLSLFVSGEDVEEIIEGSFVASALTHAHVRSMLCCAFHSLVVDSILAGKGIKEAMHQAAVSLEDKVPETERLALSPLLTGSILCGDEPHSSGYVVHTLEAALWCCHNCDRLEDAVLAAVNLGDDTDTTGAVTGGLAGLVWGVDAIPQRWIDALARRAEVVQMACDFTDSLLE